MEQGQLNLPSPEFSIESNNSNGNTESNTRLISNESFDSGIQSRIQSKLGNINKHEFDSTHNFNSIQVKREASLPKELHEFTYVHSFINVSTDDLKVLLTWCF